MAENAFCVAWICCTPLSWSRTAEPSPPECAEPQVTTALSPWHHKAKAVFVAASCGWSTRAVRHSPSSISAASNVLLGSTRTRLLAVISLRHFRQRLVGLLSLNLELWKKAEVTEVQHPHSAKLRSLEASSWDVLGILTTASKTSAMNLYFRLWARAKQEYMIGGACNLLLEVLIDDDTMIHDNCSTNIWVNLMQTPS